MTRLEDLKKQKLQLQKDKQEEKDIIQTEKDIQEMEEEGTFKGTLKKTMRSGWSSIFSQADKIAQDILKGKKKKR